MANHIDRSRTYGPEFFMFDGTQAHRGHGPMTEETSIKRNQAIQAAGEHLAEWALTCESMTPREQAESAWTPTSPYSVDELEDLIRAERGYPAVPDKPGREPQS